MRLDLFREGEDLVSPSTGEVLGRVEQDLGDVMVTQVAETYAVARLTWPTEGGRVQAGDQVRITAGRIPLGLLPATDLSGRAMPLDAIADAMQQSLSATGRFQVVPRARLAMWLLDRGLSPRDVPAPRVMVAAARSLGVAYFAQPVLRDAGEMTVVELRLYEPNQRQVPIFTALATLSEFSRMVERPASSSAPQRQAAVSLPPARPDSPPAVPVTDPRPPARNRTALQDLLNLDLLTLEARYVPLAQFAEELRGFDAADIDVDGQTELLMLNETEVLLFKVHEDRLAPFASYSDQRPGTLLSAQLVRLGDAPVPGVVVNRYNPTRKGMDSFLLALQDNRLVRLQVALPDILLAVDADGDGVNESVWGQRFDGKDFFRRGQVRQYELRDGRLKRQRKVVSPVGFRATGAALAQLERSGSRQLVFVDAQNSLQVCEGKTRRWRSTVDVGGSYVFGTINILHGSGTVERAQFGFEAIPAVADFDGDGIDEVLVPQNQARLGVVQNLNVYSGGHVGLMRQTPQGFVLSPISPGFDGVVSGVAVLKDRVPGILVAVSKREGIIRQRNQTTIYLNRL